MFTGKHPITQDQDGRYFIDEDPSGFSLILSYLRTGEIEGHRVCLSSVKLAERLGIKSFVEQASDCKDVIADEQRRKIKSWYPHYNEIVNKIIEHIKVKLSTPNKDTIDLMLKAREEERMIPGEITFYVRPAAEDPYCFFLFKVIEGDLMKKGFYSHVGKWEMECDGQTWHGCLNFHVRELLMPF